MKQLFLVMILLWAQLTAAQYSNDFESWPILADGDHTLEGPGGTWQLWGCYVNFGNTSSGLRKVGFNAPGDAIDLPPALNPTLVSFSARLSSGAGATVIVQYHNGSAWVTTSTFTVNSTSYNYFSTPLSFQGPGVPTRIAMTAFGNSVFIDDVGVEAGVLPVELADFRIERTREGIALHWRTLSESGNDRFDILRSGENGEGFEHIGSVAGAGSTLEPREYRFVDEHPLPGKSYYRLRQVDLDGSFVFSEWRSVELETARGLTISPNPAGERLNLLLKPCGKGRAVRILNLRGELALCAAIPAGSRQCALEISSLQAGAYVLQLFEEQRVFVEKFVKI